jgi:hypothetical protein
MVEITINYFATDLSMKDKLMIRECLKLIHFGIGNTLITFEEKFEYFEYDGDRDVNNKGDVLENTAHLLEDATIYDGIYRDDGLVVFRGNWSKSKITKWLEKSQKEVNKVNRYDGLQFTISIWGAEKEDGTTHEKVTVEQTDYLVLPFLDMKLYWDKNENLAVTVYQKPGQQLKYLNKDSAHPPHVFRAIPLVVLSRLANLTSYDATNKHKTMKDLHPGHCDALEKANLTSNQAKSKSPTLHYMKQCINLTYSAKELKKQKDNASNRGIYFCIVAIHHLLAKTSSSCIESPKREAQPMMVESVNVIPPFS